MKAILHILGANGVGHNGKLLKPNHAQSWVNLAEGDKLQISKHILSFSYKLNMDQCQELSVRLSDSEAIPGCYRNVKAESPVTPRRQSARLKAKYSSPCLKESVETSDCLKRYGEESKDINANQGPNEPSLMQTLVAESSPCLVEKPSNDALGSETGFETKPIAEKKVIHILSDATNFNEDKSSRVESRRPAEESAVVQDLAHDHWQPFTKIQDNQCVVSGPKEHHWEVRDEQRPMLTDTEASVSERPENTPECTDTQDKNTKELQQPDTESKSSSETENADQTLHLDALEAAAIENDLCPMPSAKGPSTPQPSSVRLPQSLPRNLPITPPLQWTPSKSRKISLRTATLLKRSAQYPLPLLETNPNNEPVSREYHSPVPPRTSTGSRDMDMTQDFVRTTAEDPDVSSDDEVEIEKSLGLSKPESEHESTVLGEKEERAPALAGFLTPQPPKQRTLRRISNPETMETSKLRSRSSWQWLRDLFSPGKQQIEGNKNAESPAATETPKKVTSGDSEKPNSTSEGKIAEDPEPVQDEFYDVNTEQFPDEMDGPVMDKPAENSTVPDVSLTHISWMYQLPASPQVGPNQDEARTPDMQVLKHMFAEPSHTASDAVMQDFRHMMRLPTTPQDVSLVSAWHALEEDDTEQQLHDAMEEVSLSEAQNAEQERSPQVAKQDEESVSQEHGTDEPIPSTVPEPMLKESKQEIPCEADAELSPQVKEQEVFGTKQVLPTPPDVQSPKTETITQSRPEKQHVLGDSRILNTEDNMAVKNRRRSVNKNTAKQAVPVRMSPRRAAAQTLRSTAFATDSRSSGMATRTVPQKAPYVPIRRQLPARAAVSSLRTLSTTATRASRSAAPTMGEDVTRNLHAEESVIGSKQGTTRSSSIPLSSMSRRAPSTSSTRHDNMASRGPSANVGSRPTRTTRNVRRS